MSLGLPDFPNLRFRRQPRAPCSDACYPCAGNGLQTSQDGVLLSRGAGLGPGISSHSRRGHLGPMRIMYHSVKKGGKPCPKLDLVLALSWPKAVCSPVMSAWPGNTCFPPTSYLLASTPQAKGSPCMHNCPWPGIGSVAPDVNGASRGHCPAQSLAREASRLPSLRTSQAQASRQLSGPAQPWPGHAHALPPSHRGLL